MLSFSCLSQQHAANEGDELNSSALEELSESDETESEDDYDAQQLSFYKKHPLDINGKEISALPLLQPLHIANLSAYRSLLGDIINIHELQAVPGFTVDLIKSIVPYVTVKKENLSVHSLQRRITGGEHTLLVRGSFVPERAEGFRKEAGLFIGSRPAIFSRYRYRLGNIFQYGLLIEKDPGEKLLQSGSLPLPDFVSFHIFSRHTGLLKTIAIGDYTLNLGQGLIHWQSQAFRKSSAVINIKRQSETLRPYSSVSEHNFQRGAAVTLARKGWEGTFFISVRRLSANKSTDSVYGRVVSSILTAGLHRSAAEREDKNALTLYSPGAALKKIIKNGHFGLNAVSYMFSLPILKRQEPYNIFSIKGQRWTNYSIDYSYTLRNIHLFGEAAFDGQLHRACINGVMASLGSKADIAILFRVLDKKYQSVYGNAFTEGTLPSNESGLYTGFAFKPNNQWKIDLYCDIYDHPWFRYRLDAPSAGFSYLVGVTYKPHKATVIMSRFRYRMKPTNLPAEIDEDHILAPDQVYLQNWRTQINYQVSKAVAIRCRVEWCISRKPDLQESPGYLFFTDVIYKPTNSWLTGNVRIQTFEAQTYDSRIYAYENDILYAGATPAFYNNGMRYYVNLKGTFRLRAFGFRHLVTSFKAGTTVYKNLESIGTGSSLISNNRVSIIKLQFYLSS